MVGLGLFSRLIKMWVGEDPKWAKRKGLISLWEPDHAEGKKGKEEKKKEHGLVDRILRPGGNMKQGALRHRLIPPPPHKFGV